MTQEMEVLANINHPNIMRIYELLEDETNYYIVSEILGGGELFNFIV
jgi:serine/threonine protein kinase